MSYYRLVASHRGMVFDEVRNRAYFRAIRENVGSTSVVLDVGAGIGVLGLEAARQGARKVYLVDPEPAVHLAREIAIANDLVDRIEIFQTSIEQARVPETVDSILSVFTGNFLLEEDLLPLLFFARDRFLAPNGTLIPDRARMEIVPVSASRFYSMHIGAWDRPGDGLDCSAGRRYAANTVYFDSTESFDAEFLAPPQCLHELDFHHAQKAECHGKVSVEFECDEVCHGLMGWFSMRLGSAWLSTGPDRPATHWSQAFFPLDPPIEVLSGQLATIELERPEHGDWTWTLISNGVRQRHSTFLSVPATRSEISKSAGFYKPKLNQLGLAAQAALVEMDGSAQIDDITDHIFREHPKGFRSKNHAGRFVRRLTSRYV